MAVKRVLIDTDPGNDDAIALLMALGPYGSARLEILGVTTVGGNAHLARTTRNALAVLEYAGRGDLLLAKGASRPLSGAFPYGYYFHGPGGLSERLPTARSVASGQGAVEYLRDRLMAGPKDDGITLIALGPLTNLAKLLDRHPEAGSRISSLVAMGGAVGVRGNITPHAEFNFYSDPWAARKVLSSGVETTLVDLSVCRQVPIDREGVARLLEAGRMGRLAGLILSGWFRRNPDAAACDLCDPLAMAVAMDSDIMATRTVRVGVETDDADRRGESAVEAGDGAVRVATDVDVDRFFRLFYSALD